MADKPSADTQFRAVYDAHYGAVRNYCLRRLPLNDVGDAMAEIFTVVWRRLESVPPADEALPWIYGIARNVLANQQRSSRRFARLSAKLGAQAQPADPGPEPVVVRREADQRMVAALAELRPEEQELLRLRAWEQLSSAQIGDALGISPDAVDMRLARARRKLESIVAAGAPRPRLQKGGER